MAANNYFRCQNTIVPFNDRDPHEVRRALLIAQTCGEYHARLHYVCVWRPIDGLDVAVIGICPGYATGKDYARTRNAKGDIVACDDPETPIMYAAEMARRNQLA